MKNLGKFLVVAIILVAGLKSCKAYADEYNRNMFGKGWNTQPSCLNTRHQVLFDESLIPATVDKCKVVRGLWVDPYTGAHYLEPGRLDVDHLVPLEHAWQTGAHQWDQARRNMFANDLANPHHLIGVSFNTNRSKGAKSPNEWMPPNISFWNVYLINWSTVKLNYKLEISDQESNAIERLYKLHEKFSNGIKITEKNLQLLEQME